jgi:hypothetical protein
MLLMVVLGTVSPVLADSSITRPSDEGRLPTKDAVVTMYAPDMNINTEMLGMGMEDGVYWRTYVTFYIGDLSENMTAHLYMEASLFGHSHESSGTISVMAYGVDNIDWLENGITWNNPPVGDSMYVATDYYPRTAFVYQTYVWESWNVSAWVNMQIAADKDYVTFMFRGLEDSVLTDHVSYRSSEHDSPSFRWSPYLHVDVATSVTPPPATGPSGGLGIGTWASLLGAALGVSAESAGILMSVLVMVVLILPLAYLGLPPVGIVGIILIITAMTAALGWMPVWISVIICVGFGLILAREVAGM